MHRPRPLVVLARADDELELVVRVHRALEHAQVVAVALARAGRLQVDDLVHRRRHQPHVDGPAGLEQHGEPLRRAAPPSADRRRAGAAARRRSPPPAARRAPSPARRPRRSASASRRGRRTRCRSRCSAGGSRSAARSCRAGPGATTRPAARGRSPSPPPSRRRARGGARCGACGEHRRATCNTLLMAVAGARSPGVACRPPWTGSTEVGDEFGGEGRKRRRHSGAPRSRRGRGPEPLARAHPAPRDRPHRGLVRPARIRRVRPALGRAPRRSPRWPRTSLRSRPPRTWAAPILIGHSYGGAVAGEAVARFPDRFAAAVFLDAPGDAPESSRGGSCRRRAAWPRTGTAPPAAPGSNRILHDARPETRQHVLATLGLTPRETYVGSMESNPPLRIPPSSAASPARSW